MKLTLLRHGITEGNLRRLYYGSTDLPLLPEGRAALETLAKSGMYPTAARYYTSGMLRTEQTLAVLYGNVPHQILHDLREMDFGIFEMQSYEQLKDDLLYQKWLTGAVEENICPNGESAAQVSRRALQALQPLLVRGEDAVCVTHGGVIAGVMDAWFPEQNHRYGWTPQPGTGYQITFQNRNALDYCIVPV